MKKAFTLIELLVVIAIIAILAAILFPVFAQAKAAAKSTAALSNTKQSGLACLMYAGDADDAFPLATLLYDGNFTTWQFTVEPYTKNFGIVLDPRLPSPPADQNGSPWFFQTAAHWGMPTRGAANTGYVAPSGTDPGTWYFQSASQTGGEQRLLDGIAGNGVQAGQIWGNQADAPSLTATAVSAPSDQIMIAEGGLWDFGWGFVPGTPMNYSVKGGFWQDATLNVTTGTNYLGPHSRKNAKTYDGYHGDPALPYPDGMTTYVAVDGSAKVVNWKGGIAERLDLGDGRIALKRLWPNGN